MRKFLLLLTALILLSCTQYKYDFTTEINAEIVGRTHNCMGLSYELYGVQILQDVCNLSVAKMGHFKDNKTIPLRVYVKAYEDEAIGDKVELTLYYKDEEFASSKQTPQKLKPHMFVNKDEQIEGFKWYWFNNVEYDSDGITPAQLREKLAENDQKKEDVEEPAEDEENVDKAEPETIEEGKKL